MQSNQDLTSANNIGSIFFVTRKSKQCKFSNDTLGIPFDFAASHSCAFQSFKAMMSEHSGHWMGLSKHFFSCDRRLPAVTVSLQWAHFSAGLAPDDKSNDN